MGSLSGAGKRPSLFLIETIVVEGAIGVRADEKRDAAAAADVVFERGQLVVGQSRHIEQANGRLLVELLGIGQETGRLDVRLPTGARVAAGGEGERKLMTAAAIGRAIDDQDGPRGRQIAGEVAAVVDARRHRRAASR